MDDDARPGGQLTILAGPSGAGKGSVIGLIRARSPSLWVSVPVTTRPRRTHEIDGIHYFFRPKAEVEQLIVDGQLLEWVEIAGNVYGTSGIEVQRRLRARQGVLLSLDLPGACQVAARIPEALLVLLVPPAGPGPVVTVPPGFEVLVHDRTERAAEELVGLLGSPS